MNNRYSMTSTSTGRRKRDESDEPLVESSKKQKLPLHDTSVIQQVGSGQVGATELASAFALASLASLSPKQTMFTAVDEESRDADNGNEHIPVSPESRSPLRRFRRVTFSNDTKDPRSDVSRSVSFSPRTSAMQVSSVGAGSTHYSSFNTAPTYWMTRQHLPTSVSAFHVPFENSYQQSGHWICDFCNSAAFDSYEDACVHEESCHMKRMSLSRLSSPHGQWRGLRGVQPLFLSQNDAFTNRNAARQIAMEAGSSNGKQCFHGTISLAIPDSDKEWLSNANCFIRSKCVEAFSATEEEISHVSKRGRISIYQVGIRCCFCRHRPKDKKEVAAVSYPATLAGIYESVKRWQRVHMELCQDIPTEVKTAVEQCGTENAWIPTTRQYWVDSARSLGLVDTHEGIRFSIDPKCLANITSSTPSPVMPPMQVESDARKLTEPTKKSIGPDEGESIVFPDDVSMVPPYVYYLMRQVESTTFTEADRFVARSKGPVGFPGFQCRHCHGHAGLGKYFPVTCKSLSTNSTSQNIHSHLLKCRKVSPYVKDQLLSLKDEKSKSPRLEPGWRRVFFEKIWERLHGSTEE